MPRPRKPTKVLDLTGRLKHNPKRYRDRLNEPVHNAPLGGPPDHLPPTEREIWAELAKQLVEGVALASDRAAFETLTRLVSMERAGQIQGKDRGHLLRLYQMFGMSPSDRSRVSAPAPAKAGNPFGNLGG